MTRTVAIALAAAVAACADHPSAPADASFQIEDSAGVRIVAYDRTPTSEAAFRFPSEPRYRHGANPGDYNFQAIRVGSLFPDGGADGPRNGGNSGVSRAQEPRDLHGSRVGAGMVGQGRKGSLVWSRSPEWAGTR